jgi:hypothetical protein
MGKKIIVCKECGNSKKAECRVEFCSARCYRINRTRKKIVSGEITYRNKRAIKRYLIDIRGHKCEKCLNENWLYQKIPLEIHHEDGDVTNMDLRNLKLLCPNCHTLTDTYKSKNKHKNSNRKLFKK